jgi:hypothetical protein
LLLLREQSVETSELSQAAIWKDRKVDELSLGILPLDLGGRRIELGGVETRIGVEDLKFGARANYCTIGLGLNTEDFKVQQGVDIDFRGIGGRGDDHGTFRLDVFVAVVADLVGESLASVESGSQIHGGGFIFRSG